MKNRKKAMPDADAGFDMFEDNMSYWDPELLDENYMLRKSGKGRHRNRLWRKPRERDLRDNDLQ